ncbi:hypothetical protein M422DRAFT_258190 [Sphaerobolus stellatus SS14]|uniref:Uncharacterized protein n=1 Tax=Sphaerobolus stellatus (strain SS14) TaxID=990650 RepID=A0A0C9U7R6_SPHS4|nr:hypothetical protein M422DRAFT_258190 [Sphaerobolus stellatus SS14]
MSSRKLPRFGLSEEELTRRQVYHTQREKASYEVEIDEDDQRVSHLVAQPREEFYMDRKLVDSRLPRDKLTLKEKVLRENTERDHLEALDKAISDMFDIHKKYMTSSEDAKRQGLSSTQFIPLSFTHVLK